jgi:flagellar hook assembly protein FlgD
MRKKATLLAVLITVMSTSLFASNDRGDAKENTQALVRNTGRKAVYQVVYQSAHRGSVTVNILDGKGNVIMVDRIKNTNEGFMRPYNFSSLAEGDYQIEINDHNGKVVLPLNHAVAVAPVKVKIEALEAKKFQLVMVGQPAEGLQVDILDNNNKVVFSDFITAQSSFRKVYNLNQVQAENFKFEVRSQNRIITTEKF